MAELSFQNKITPVETPDNSGLSFADKITPVIPTPTIQTPETSTSQPSIVETLKNQLPGGMGNLPFQNPVEAVRNAYSEAVNNIIGQAQKDLSNPKNIGHPVQAIAQAGLDIAGGAVGGSFNALLAGAKALIPTSFKETVKSVVSHAINQTPALQIGLGALKQGLTVYNDWKSQNPEDAQHFENVLNLLTLGAPEVAGNITKEAAPLIKEAGTAIKEGASAIKESLTKAPEVSTFVDKYYPKAIKPSVSGINTIGTVNQAKERTVQAITSIIENKSSLILNGETGRLPQNVREFGDAIDQTKQSIYQKYNALAKEATGKEVEIDLNPIAQDLNKIADNPVLKDNNPDVVKYARDKSIRLSARGTYTPEQTQEAIQNYNTSLKAFYRNPSYETASKAAVDASVVSQMRLQLDAMIEKATGKEYQSLKNQYGALKSIEKDVTKATLRIARKNPKGLLDFTDIASGAEAMHWIITHNPADFATAGAIKAISAWQKYLNNPDIMIAKMFSKAEKVISP